MNETCPLCATEGKSSSIRHFQISYDDVLVNCENPECCYPFGTNTSIPLTMTRSYKGVNIEEESQVRTDTISTSSNSLPFISDPDTEALPQVDSLLLEGCTPHTDIDSYLDFDFPDENSVVLESTDAFCVANLHPITRPMPSLLDSESNIENNLTECNVSINHSLDSQNNFKIVVLENSQTSDGQTNFPINSETIVNTSESVLPVPKVHVHRSMHKSVYSAMKAPPTNWQSLSVDAARKQKLALRPNKPKVTSRKYNDVKALLDLGPK